LSDFDVRERRASLGERGCKHFFVVDQWLAGTDAAALDLDQVTCPAGSLPLDRSPIGAGQLGRYVQGAFDAKGSPERMRQGLRAWRERARPRSYPIFFNGSGIWNMGFIVGTFSDINRG
jgi:hypothetical protein